MHAGDETIWVHSQDDVVAARRLARERAKDLGFDAFAAAAVTTATSELARNIFVHGGGGRVVIRTVERDGRKGLEIEFHDQGPGIDQLDRALQGGWSTKRSLGLGLSGSRRLVDDFTVDTAPGQGTHIRVAKWARR